MVERFDLWSRFMKVLTFVSRCDLQTALSYELISAGFVVETVASVKECLQFARSEHYKGVLVDSESLSFEDVVWLVTLLRQENPQSAVFVLAGYLDLEQRLRLFEAGVDDCSCGEVFASELAVRFSLSVRLHQAAASPTGVNRVCVLRCGDLELDLIRRNAVRMGKAFDLRPKEFQLLEYLVRNANRPVTRSMILEHVWNSSFEGLTNVVDVYIGTLRRKIDRGFPQKMIQTNHGIGYTFACAEERSPNSLSQGSPTPFER
jgi:two-component system, OmpR family, response regulator